jgi:hypothetical protein
MKNITLSADAGLIDAARQQAQAEKTTLNEQFRIWLAGYVSRRHNADSAMALVDSIAQYAQTGGRKFSRDEMNER